MKTIKKLKGLLKAVVFAMLMVFVLHGCEKYEVIELNEQSKIQVNHISLNQLKQKTFFKSINKIETNFKVYQKNHNKNNKSNFSDTFEILTDLVYETTIDSVSTYSFLIRRTTPDNTLTENLVISLNNNTNDLSFRILQINLITNSLNIYNIDDDLSYLLNKTQTAYFYGVPIEVPNCAHIIYTPCDGIGTADGHAPTDNCNGSHTTIDLSYCFNNNNPESIDYSLVGDGGGGESSSPLYGGANIQQHVPINAVTVVPRINYGKTIHKFLQTNNLLNTPESDWVNSHGFLAIPFGQAIIAFPNNPNLALDVLHYLMNNDTIPSNGINFQEIFDLTSNSPFNLDISQINNNILPLPQDDSPEAVKLRCVFKKLTQSPKFKSLFVDTFGENINLNIGFEFSTDLPDSTNGKTVTTGTIINGNTTLKFKIKINKNTLLNRSNIGLARTIIHEAIHAFLITKNFNCQTGTSLPYLNNTELGVLINDYYQNFTCAGNQSQHEFMFDYMLPTIQNILLELKNDLIPSNNQTAAESITLYNESLNINENWNWENFFYYFSMNGLQQTSSFQNEISNNPINNFLQSTYAYTGENSFSKVCN